MVTYNTVLEDAQYIAIAKKAAEYFQEDAITNVIPLITTDTPDQLYYRHVPLGKSKVSQGISDDWSPQGEKADTEHGYVDFYLGGREMHLVIPKKGINQYVGENLLADKRRQEIRQFALDVDLTNIVGNYPDLDDRDGLLDAGGLIGQATTVEDLDGSDSNLSTKGDIWKGINKMIDAIPLRLRVNAPPMLLFGSENIIKNAKAPDRVYNDAVEWDFITRTLMGELAPRGRRIGQVIITNNILVQGTDTLGTHDRLMLIVPHEDIIARVVSRGFSLLDEEQVMFGIHQAWGWRGSLCVFDTDGVQFSEQIVWA